MKGQKALITALCCCVLALCGALGLAVHFRQESKEAETRLTLLQGRNDLLESELLKLGAQLAQAEEEKAAAEKGRDYAQLRYEWATETDNPIDRYRYASNRDSGSTTYEMSANAAFFREAWKQELEHLIEVVGEKRKNGYGNVDEEWKIEYTQTLDNYQKAVEEQADAIGNIVLLNRDAGYTGSMGSMSLSSYQASIYRYGTLELLWSFSDPMEWQKVYSYAFDEDTVTQLREKIGDPLAERVPGDQLFPPLSQVLPDQP